jgi:membrane-associated phospholipid phosphatase
MEKTPNSRTVSQHLAHVISEISNPLFIALPTFFVIALMTAPNLLHAILWWIIAVLGISVAPFLFIMQGVRKGKLTDHHVSKREQRLVPLVFGLVCMVLSFVFLYLFRASPVLIATVVAVIVACVISLIVTKYWKISLHLVGMAGAVTVFVILFGPRLLVLSPLVLLIGWARWQVRAHTIYQAIAGTILAVVVTVATFFLFGIHV